MKIAYLGIDILSAALEAVLAQNHQVLGLFTCPTDNVTEFNLRVKALAQSRHIPIKEERITAADLADLAKAGCQLLLCAGYYYRVPLTDAFPMVNLHPAPLPHCRGAWPMPLIIQGAWPQGGAALHLMAKDFDTGPVIMQSTFPITSTTTLMDYQRILNEDLVPPMVHALLSDLPGWLSKARPQGNGRYLPMPTEADWTVDAAMTVEQADSVLRAYLGYECLYRQGETLTEIIGGRAVPGLPQGQYPLRDGYITAEKARLLPWKT